MSLSGDDRHDLSGQSLDGMGIGPAGPQPRGGIGLALAFLAGGLVAGSAATWAWMTYASPATVAAAAPAAVASADPRVVVETLRPGSGGYPTVDDVVLLNYTMGVAGSDKVLDSGKQAVMPLDGVIPGFRDAVMRMQKGGDYRVKLPARLGYGDRAAGPIPANSDLWFQVELIDFRSKAEVEAARAAQGGATPPEEAMRAAGDLADHARAAAAQK